MTYESDTDRGQTPSNRGAVEFIGVSFTYPGAPAPALSELSFSVLPGEFLAVLGANGSGKSTLCKCVDGIVPNSEGGRFSGKVISAGMDTREFPVAALARRVGLVLEDPDAQLFATTVLDEAAFGPENIEMEAAEIRDSVSRALDAVGLSGLEERPPSTLSGGQKQRLALAGALAMKPDILVLDEPTSRLDGEGAENLMKAVTELKKSRGLTVIMTTHNLELAATYADRVLVLSGGRSAALGTPSEIFARKDLPGLIAEPVRRRRKPDSGTTQDGGGGPVLEVRNLSCVYPGGVRALNGVSLLVRPGEFVGIVGRNGSGKTTLLKCLVGMAAPSSGSALVGGLPAEGLSPGDLAARVGYVQQNPDLQLFADTLGNEVSFGPVNLGLSAEEIKRRVAAALEAVGLSDKSEEHPLGLGRGDRSLTALASVLAMEPALLLLDEPTQGQDAAGALRVMELACRLRDGGRGVVAVGHDLSLLADYADRIIVLDGGDIIEDGTPETILSRPDLLLKAGLRLPKTFMGIRGEIKYGRK